MSYQVIARKWRPQTFDDLVGQQHVTETLKNAIKNDRVAHAYIFSGARGVGKTTAARILAKALNCVNGPTADPCGVCDSCKEIAAGTSLDVIEIDAASNRGIDQIRELREMVRYAPAAARSKVVILDEVVAAIASGSADRALALVHTFQREGRNLQHFCREAIRHIRNLLVARVCGADSELIAATPDQRPALARAAEQFTEEDLTRFFQILLQTDDDLRRKPDPRVHLEMGLLRLINAARLAPLEELLAEVRAGVPAVNTGASRGAPVASIPAMPRREFT